MPELMKFFKVNGLRTKQIHWLALFFADCYHDLWVAFLFKYQEVIKDSLNWFDNEITISSQVIQENNNGEAC